MKLLYFICLSPILILSQEIESNLPIIFINTGGQTILDNPRIICQMGIINNKDGTNNSNDNFNDYNGQISIEMRGSSSQQIFPKKSYSLETQTSTGENNNVSILDLPDENDWVLYAPYSDKTLLRNSLSYEISRKMGYYAPRTKYCEVFINSEYMGIYVLTEKIKQDTNRVNIPEFNKTIDSGGYIIKIDKLTEAEPNSSWCSNFKSFNGDNVCFQYHYPKADEISEEQKTYIEIYINSLEQDIHDLSYNIMDIEEIENINIRSFIDYIIISELSKDVDAYRLSLFFNKQSLSLGGEFSVGPVWDYNLSFGNVDFCRSSNISGWVINEETPCRTSIPDFWLKLIQNDSFRMKLTERWFELRTNVLDLGKIYNHIDSISNLLDVAKDRNFEKWDNLGEWIWPNYQLGVTYQDEIEFIKFWIYQRINWIDNNINELRLIVSDCSSNEKKLIYNSNNLGQKINDRSSGINFLIYDNGCVEKKVYFY